MGIFIKFLLIIYLQFIFIIKLLGFFYYYIFNFLALIMAFLDLLFYYDIFIDKNISCKFIE